MPLLDFLREKQPEQSYKAVPMEQASATVVSTSVNNTLHTKTKSNVEVTSKYSNPEIKRGPPPQPPVQRTQMPLVRIIVLAVYISYVTLILFPFSLECFRFNNCWIFSNKTFKCRINGKLIF